MRNIERRIDIEKYTNTHRIFNTHLFMLVREIILNSFPGINESVQLGLPIYEYKDTRVCFIVFYENHMQVIFFNGEALNDYFYYTSSNNNFFNQVDIHSKEDLDPFIIYRYVKQALDPGKKEKRA